MKASDSCLLYCLLLIIVLIQDMAKGIEREIYMKKRS